MDSVFTDITACSASDLGPCFYDREQLLTTLRQAALRSAQVCHEVLASLSMPVALCDALHVLRAFEHMQSGECFYWEQPSRHSALVGTGQAAIIETSGPERFAAATSAWRTLQDEAIVAYTEGMVSGNGSGPILFGGFAFDALSPRTSLWEGFPDGLLILPHVLFHANDRHASLTLNQMVQADSNIEEIAREFAATLARIQAAVSMLARGPETQEVRGQLSEQDLLEPGEWQEIIANAVRSIKGGAYEKVVLARGVQVVREGEPFAIEHTLARLRASYPSAYVFAIQRGPRHFVGATPERLIYGQDGQLRTMALAGSYPRGSTEEEDQRLGRELLQSAKNKEEHEIVVETVRTALATLCSTVWIAETPHLLRLKNIQHLETPIVGELLPGRCVLEALESLHPTPAVGGLPRQPALEAIRAEEKLDRGWYAGPVGWLDANGNGEFAVALRSALVSGDRATLFAGCGIVADSDPESEYAESCWKLQVMLRSLGGED